jgi:competence ComEA-like helix-hairpin-helix protein
VLWISAVSFWVLFACRINCRSQTITVENENQDEILFAFDSTNSTEETSAQILHDSIQTTSDPAVLNPQKQADGCVNVNTANEEQLTLLPGIGTVISGRIIALRKEKGRIASPEELLEVKGIGPVKLEKIKRFICF